MAWQPKTFLRFEESLDTSMGTARILTDAGRAYIKALGNRQGPHPLACEWVATQLADWFGLPTFEYALMTIDETVDEIPFRRGGKAKSGSAFVTRAVSGHTWGGTPEELNNLANLKAISRLVVFDTWTSNCDRYPPDLGVRRANYDNVFLADVTNGVHEQQRLIAMDHTHCFTCGRDLDNKLANIGLITDDRLYGLFPGFVPFVRQDEIEAGISRLSELSVDFVAGVVNSIPADWIVDAVVQNALIQLICRRAEFTAESVLARIANVAWPGKLFDSGH